MAEEKNEQGVNVQVLLRCRPATDREVMERTPQVVSCSEALREVTLIQNTAGKHVSKTFRFDRVFGPDSQQEKLYKQAIVPIVNEVMDGFNCTIFAYGQTGTGKTYTMEGGPRDSTDGRKLSAEAGVIPRSIKQIFDTIETKNLDSTVKVSFLELYNEELTDLLSNEEPSTFPASNAPKSADDKKALRLLEDKNGVVVQGLEEVIVRSAAEIYSVLDKGTAKRRTAATLLNSRSSRSHSIFTVTIHLKEATPEGEDVIKIGKLNLVDLAGSENINRSGAKDGRAREAGSINQSLLTLGRVITTLVEHSGHIPYRDSKLTRLLRDSLGGKTKTCIIATIAPTVQCQEETISTLDYAHRAKNIKNKPEVNQKISKVTMIKDLATEIERLRMDLACTRDKNGIYLSSERYEQGEMERIQLRDQVKSSKAELELMETTNAQEIESMKLSHDKEIDFLQSELDATSQRLSVTQDKLNEAQITIQERQFIAAAHRRAEKALSSHAERLTSELASCADDMKRLYSKLEEMIEMQGSDRALLQELKSQVQSRMEVVGSFVSDAVKSQAQYLSSVNSEADAFKARNQAECDKMQTQIDQCHAMASSMKAGSEAALDEVGSLLKSTTDEAREKSLAFAASLTSNQVQAEQRTLSALSALTSAVAKHAEQLQAGFAARHRDGVEASSRALKSLSSETQQDLVNSKALINSLRNELNEKSKENEAALALAAASIEESAHQQQADLMKKVSEMVASFAAERGQQASKALMEARSMMTAGVARADELALLMCNETDAVVKKLQDKEMALSSAIKQSGEEVQCELMGLGAEIQLEGREGEAAAPSIEASFKQEKALVSSHVQELVSHLGKSSDSGADATLAAKGHSSTIFAQLDGLLTKELKGAVRGQGEIISASADKIKSAADEASNKIDAFGSKYSLDALAISGHLAGAVDGQLLKTVVISNGPETGKIPHKRSILEGAPDMAAVHELACPPEDALLVQFKREKTQALSQLRSSGGLKHPAPPKEDQQGPPEKKMRRTTEMEATENVAQVAMEEVATATVSEEVSISSPTKNVTQRSRIPRSAGLVDKSNQI